MPTYDYHCPKCETTFEVFHGMTEKPRVRCTVCKRLARKQIGAGAGLLFKGSGFYQTDYRSSSYQSSAKADQAAPPPAPAATESSSAAPKTESKPAKAPAAPDA